MAELEPLYTAAEMKEAEAGHDVEHLMQRAGGAVADAVARDYPGARVVAVCGRGANGGDGRIAAEKLGGLVVAPGQNLQETDVIVDALFGTGFHGEPREEAARSIAAINSAGVPVVAVDIPSGVDASTGEIGGAAVEAELTVTFHGRKVGLVVGPGRFRTGRVELVDIGLEPAETEHRLATRELLRRVPRKRPQDNKYSAGSVLVVGGAPGTTGAACLAAEAAFRADAGYVTVCAPKESLPVIETRLLEAVKRPLEDVFEAVERAGALALGPGLGRSEERRGLVRRLLAETDLPAVVDADALFELEPVAREAPTVLTPHSGELGRLLGEESSWVDAHRFEAVRRGAEHFGALCVLKGADTLVAEPAGRVVVCDLGTPALATAGSGDVLTGIVAAFLAKGMEPALAAAAASAAAGVDSELAPRAGVVASDVIALLPQALDAPV